jgi:hypothetical protein
MWCCNVLQSLPRARLVLTMLSMVVPGDELQLGLGAAAGALPPLLLPPPPPALPALPLPSATTRTAHSQGPQKHWSPYPASQSPGCTH